MAVIGVSYALYSTNKDRNRLKSNQVTLLSDVVRYKTNSGKNAASVQKLTLTKKELEKNCSYLENQIKDLNIKLKRVQSISSTATQSDYDIITTLKDSIVYKDRIKYITLRTIKYSDPWINISGIIDSINFKGKIQTRDTLNQVIHRIPKKFLFFRFGCKAIVQDVKCSNPHSEIEYTKYVEMK